MSRLRTVLFDLDGTLADSVRLILDSYHHTLQVHGIPPRTDEYWLRGLGTPLTAQFAPWAEDDGRMAAMIASYREYNLSNHDSRVAPYPGVVEAVHVIRESGFRTGLVTSKNHAGALRGLRVLGLEGTMEIVVGADDVRNAKPHPEPVRKALDGLGECAETAVFVGDSLHDLESGRAAGTRTAAVLWGPFDRAHLEPGSPDHWLDHPADLLKVLGLE